MGRRKVESSLQDSEIIGGLTQDFVLGSREPPFQGWDWGAVSLMDEFDNR
jgi:hypothetical protein